MAFTSRSDPLRARHDFEGWGINAGLLGWFQCVRGMFVLRRLRVVDRMRTLAYVPRQFQSLQPTVAHSMLFTFLLVVQAIVAALLVTVILMQRSEGGGLTSGGSPSGLMSARGAANFLTRSTAVLAVLFVLMSVLLAVLAATRGSTTVDTSLARTAPPAPVEQPLPSGVDPLAGAAATATNAAAPASNASGVPLQQ